MALFTANIADIILFVYMHTSFKQSEKFLSEEKRNPASPSRRTGLPVFHRQRTILILYARNAMSGTYTPRPLPEQFVLVRAVNLHVRAKESSL